MCHDGVHGAWLPDQKHLRICRALQLLTNSSLTPKDKELMKGNVVSRLGLHNRPTTYDESNQDSGPRMSISPDGSRDCAPVQLRSGRQMCRA